MKLIVGVVGFIGSGKGTVGDYLVEQFKFKQESFAKPLKDTVAAVFNWPRSLLEGDTARSRKWREIPDEWWESRLEWHKRKLATVFPRFTPRVCLQIFGTEVFRQSFHDDIWLLSLQNRLQQTTHNAVVTDCRFVNELKAIRNEKGLLIRIKRGVEPEWYDFACGANQSTPSTYKDQCYEKMINLGIHFSEWSWIGYTFDHVIENNGTLDELHSNVASYIKGKL